MNERVKQIMLEHGLHKHISEDCQHRMEMLAELIIRECMQVADMYIARNMIPSDNIREHFGLSI